MFSSSFCALCFSHSVLIDVDGCPFLPMWPCELPKRTEHCEYIRRRVGSIPLLHSALQHAITRCLLLCTDPFAPFHVKIRTSSSLSSMSMSASAFSSHHLYFVKAFGISEVDMQKEWQRLLPLVQISMYHGYGSFV